ncbi:hypothetical protein OAE92_03135 [Akkermansiaceae bacterium]|nr:hypothetical protein [Akkermansiaceae bacterium]
MSNLLNRLLVFNCPSGDTGFEFSGEEPSMTHLILLQACCLHEDQLNS